MNIFYDTENLELTVPMGKSLLEVLLKQKIPIDHSCEGMASCGTCRIIITSDPSLLPKRNPLEQEMANNRNFAPEERLACQIDTQRPFSFKLPND